MKRLVSAIMMVWLVTALAGCGGSSSTGGQGATLSGTAATGAPISGTVTVKDALGATASASIAADGSYAVTVTGMSPPFILIAEGTSQGQPVKVYSVALAAGGCNITSMSEYVLRKALLAGDLDAAFAGWAEGVADGVDAVKLDAAKELVTLALAPVLEGTAGAGFDPLTSPFRADGTGFDAALEMLDVIYASGTDTVTVSNLLTGSTFDDVIADTADDSNTLPAADSSSVTDYLGATKFTTARLDAHPSFYKSISDIKGTSQEVLTFSGANGNYSVSINENSYDASQTKTGSSVSTSDCYLDLGVLTCTDSSSPGAAVVVSLVDDSAPDFLSIKIVDGAGATTAENWYVAPPAGWITSGGFTSADFAGKYFVNLGQPWTGVIGFSTGTTSGTAKAIGYDIYGGLYNDAGSWTLANGVISWDMGGGDTGTISLVADAANELTVSVADVDGTVEETWAKTEPFAAADVAGKTFAPSDIPGQTATFNGNGSGQLVDPVDGIMDFTWTISTDGVLSLVFTDGWLTTLYKMAGSTASNINAAVADYNTSGALDEVDRFSLVLQ